MIKTIIFNQFRGIGDILFLMNIAKMYHNVGYKIVLPVLPQFLNLQKHFDYVKFVNKDTYKMDYESKEFYHDKDKIIIPFRFALEILGIEKYEKCMRSKYDLINLDFEKWRNYEIVRDLEAEENVYIRNIGSFKGDYCFLNKNFLSHGEECKAKFELPEKMKIVEMQIMKKYTMIDWAKVICNSKEIHVVSTGLMFLLEILPIKAKKIHVYKRLPFENNHQYYDYLFKNHKYIYHE